MSFSEFIKVRLFMMFEHVCILMRLSLLTLKGQHFGAYFVCSVIVVAHDHWSILLGCPKTDVQKLMR